MEQGQTAPVAEVNAPVEGQVGQKDVLASSNKQENKDTEYNALPANDKEIISSFVKFFGQTKPGQEIVINNGKPSLLMNINGKPVVKSLQDIFDQHSMSTAGEEDLLNSKIKLKSAEAREREVGELVQAFYQDPEIFMQLSREKGYSEEQIGKIAAGLLERVIKSAESPKEIKEADALKRDYEKLKKEKDDLIKEKETEAYKKRENEEYMGIKKDIYKVMSEQGMLENEDVAEDIIISIANQMRYAAQNQVKLSAEQAMKIVMSKIPSYIDVVYKGLSDNQIRKLLPERIIKIARGESTPDLRSTPTSNGMLKTAPVKKGGATPRKKTFSEMFNQ